MNSHTVGGLLQFCSYLKDKKYLRASGAEAWRTAITKVFSAVEPETYESIGLDDLDLGDFITRFRNAAGDNYRAETVDVYARRIRRAIEAHGYYLENGRPPAFRQPTRVKDDSSKV